jgi:LmbE family N-acetylglucosaminyl deacetylase
VGTALNHVVISPHHDDALFSVGETILGLLDTGHTVRVVTPMGGHPTGERGRMKADRLATEHRAALSEAGTGATSVDGPFLDDCYEASHDGLVGWIQRQMTVADIVWCPVGIHHPDHLTVAGASLKAWEHLGRLPQLRLYEELPYRVLYPSHAEGRIREWRKTLGPLELLGYPSHQLDRKIAVVGMYESQMGEDIRRALFVPERAWSVAACS